MGALSDLTVPTNLDGPSKGNEYVIRTNPQTITQDAIIDSGTNGLSVGPLEITTGVTVTVSTGATWSII